MMMAMKGERDERETSCEILHFFLVGFIKGLNRIFSVRFLKNI